MNVIPYEAWHISRMKLQASQVNTVSLFEPCYFETLRKAGPAITVEKNGIIYGCGGIAQMGKHHGVLWSFIAEDSKKQFVRMHKIAERLLDCCRLRRVEATVEAGFDPGCRWIELLKFKYEGEMPAYGLDGQTHLRYGRVWQAR